jgi:hypothetical protein
MSCGCEDEGQAVTLTVGEEIDAMVGDKAIVIRLTYVGEGFATFVVVEK